MNVFKNIDQLPVFTNTVITIGTFDGVHLGHHSLIEKLIATAKEKNQESVLITFEPHPRLVLSSFTVHVDLLTTLDEKIALLSKYAIDNVVVVPFTAAFATLSAEDYIETFLVKLFQPSTIIIGYDHHFGLHRSGNISLLKKHEETYNYKVLEIEAKLIDEINISSTKIRKAIKQGNISEANKLLNRQYTFSGKVIQGDKRGRTIGFPTANVLVEDAYKLIPANGVYVVECLIENVCVKGMMNIGTRPTIETTHKRSIEIHLFDFDAVIYDETITVSCLAFLREEQKFENLDALKAQLDKDREMAIEFI
jgi:riboflavin kinase/FMN adenylyltransferase